MLINTLKGIILGKNFLTLSGILLVGALMLSVSSNVSALSFGFKHDHAKYFNDGDHAKYFNDADKDGKITSVESQKVAELHFASLDKNSDGKITANELSGDQENRALKFKLMLSRLDINGDQEISSKEFVDYSITRFNSIDTNKDGILSKDERNAGRDIMRAEAMELYFQAADTNGDGLLSKEEFSAMGNKFAGRHFGPRFGKPKGRGQQ